MLNKKTVLTLLIIILAILVLGYPIILFSILSYVDHFLYNVLGIMDYSIISLILTILLWFFLYCFFSKLSYSVFKYKIANAMPVLFIIAAIIYLFAIGFFSTSGVTGNGDNSDAAGWAAVFTTFEFVICFVLSIIINVIFNVNNKKA
jgi:hypothetical protein